MYNDDQSIKQFERMHARDRMIEEARHVADNNDMNLFGGHLAGEQSAQLFMSAVAIAAVAALVGFFLLAM